MKKAKNRVLFIWLAIMLALTLGLAGCALSQEEPQITSESLTTGVMTESDNSSSTIEDQIQATNRYQALLDRSCAIYQESTGVVIGSEQLKNALEQAQGELLEEALETVGLKMIKIKTKFEKRIRNGSPLTLEMVDSMEDFIKNERVGIFSKDKIIALGISHKGSDSSEEGVLVKTSRVFNI